MCNANRMRRGLTHNGDCPFCLGTLESVEHVFRKCSNDVQLWKSFLPPAMFRRLEFLGYDDWIRQNFLLGGARDFPQNWDVKFAMVLWWIWKWRNEYIFSDRSKSLEEKVCWLDHYFKKVLEAFCKADDVVDRGRRVSVKMVGWEKPEVGWVTFNTDGSYREGDDLGGCGGVFRGCNGEWLAGFCYRIGGCNALLAEVWAVLQGLRIAWDKGFRKLNVEVDSD